MDENNISNVIRITSIGDEYGYLRNDYVSWFSTGVYSYFCVEQYIMCQKAILNNDIESFAELVNSTNAGEVKEIANRVKIDNSIQWEVFIPSIMKRAIYDKFTQDKLLLSKLRDTGNREIIDCTGNNEIYTGNVLGEALMSTRDRIEKEIKLGLNVLEAYKYDKN